MTEDFDLAVLGGGPGGYVAALRGAQLGLKVCLVEKEFLGGVCLNRGCIPSKTLLAATQLFTKIEKAKDWGIQVQPPRWDTRRLFEKKEEVILKLRQGLETLCRKRKVFKVDGFGTLISPHEIKVGTETYKAKNIVLATGSVPRRLDLGLTDKARVISSEEALSLDDIPKSILILGGGPEGCEFALIFRGLGSRVILAEAQDRLLPGLDRDAGAALKRILISKNIEVHTGDPGAGRRLAGEVACVLACVGRTPNTQGMGFEKVGVRLDKKNAVAVDETLQTDLRGVYAVGDVTGRFMMAHAASYEGYVTAARVAGRNETPDYRAVPSCVYTYPEVAEVGLNEEKAEAGRVPYEVGRFSFAALGRSHAKSETEGFVKIIGHAKTGEVLGGVIVGDGASELISVISLAVSRKLKVQDLRSHIAPHPSASEAVAEAAHLFFKEGLHFA